MANAFNPHERAGWEAIWRSGDIPPRYRSFAAPNAAGGLVLDVGCGVGRHLIYLGERGFRLAGMDISPTGIQMAKEACAQRQLTVDAQVSDMTTLSWSDMTFDAALSISTIHHHRRAGIAQALSEVRRVLKPGGLLLIDVPCTDSFDYQQLRDQVTAGQIAEVEPNTFVDERLTTEDPDAFLPHHFCDEADLRDLLRSFEIIKLWAALREMQVQERSVKGGKWVVWARRPLAG